MYKHQCKPGILVRLRSGGPLMTVQYVTTRSVFCQWFENNHFGRSYFTAESLVEVKQD